MRLLRLDRLMEFIERHPDADGAVRSWVRCVADVEWRSLIDVRQTYRHADGVALDDGRVVTVFNIRGNKYRLVAGIDYRIGVVNVLKVMTHAEYSKERWKKSV